MVTACGKDVHVKFGFSYTICPRNSHEWNMISFERREEGRKEVPKSKHSEAAIIAALQQLHAGRTAACGA